MRWVVSFVVGLGVFAVGSSARADVVGPPPDVCPLGAIPDACHGGPFCVVPNCRNTACPRGLECQQVELCVEEINCGGIDGPAPTPNAVGVCSRGVGCAGFAMCQSVMGCVDPAAATTGGDDGTTGAGTSAGPTSGGTTALTTAGNTASGANSMSGGSGGDGNEASGGSGSGGSGQVGDRGCSCTVGAAHPLAWLSVVLLGACRRQRRSPRALGIS